ncbi:hypothetical protein DFJ58DRAFT_742113 [Suillus subalutaceus]|uniref:uncharacterized protein n=1 Tax=Suillus subalutaceus TaxID=48586 RepID=UPI001B883FAF|nr:uncharacterized protein DFJ58DRAFT_742113 [Suillus subalutaceus]KAG1871364.1 hypothetical protein DFJ58DRAFT_742113 [Suillus subalutaceus]
MEHTRTVVSGLSALHLFQPKSSALRLQDLDVYATEEFSEKVLNHFKDDKEYTVTNTVKWRRDYDGSAISRVHKLEKDDKMVDVIITDWISAIIPILQYHSTVVMNYMTARTFVSLYPKWTKENKSLVNSAVYMGEKSNLQTVLAIMKALSSQYSSTRRCRRALAPSRLRALLVGPSSLFHRFRSNTHETTQLQQRPTQGFISQHRPHVIEVAALRDKRAWSPPSPLFYTLIYHMAKSQQQAQSHSQASSLHPPVTAAPAISTMLTTTATAATSMPATDRPSHRAVVVDNPNGGFASYSTFAALPLTILATIT